MAQAVGVGVLALLAVGTLVSSWVWSMALQEACRPLERVDLSIDEMVDLKLKVDDSERQGSSELVLTGPEASFVLREYLSLPVYLEVHGDEVLLHAAVERDDQCYNIDYRGRVAVEEGVATVEPAALQVGDLDLGPWVSDSVTVDPEWLEGGARELLEEHVEHLRIEAGLVHLKVDDVRALR
jgi:hypothetical protein